MLALMLAAALAGTGTQESAGPALPIEVLQDAAPEAFRHWRAAMAGRSRERKGAAFLRLARAAPREFAEVMVYMSTARGEQAAVLLRDAPMEFLAVLAAPPDSARQERAMFRLGLAAPEGYAIAYPSPHAHALASLAVAAPEEFTAWAEVVAGNRAGSREADSASAELRRIAPTEWATVRRYLSGLEGPVIPDAIHFPHHNFARPHIGLGRISPARHAEVPELDRDGDGGAGNERPDP